jgi:prephenate dehydrogenase
MALFGQVTIVGCGLLGASLGLALKERGLAARVHGVGRNASTLEQALAAGAIDRASLALEDTVPDSDLIVIATPVAQSITVLEQVAALAAPEAVITDVGSTKGAICAMAHTLWPDERPFIGSHPMAGSEKHGPTHARGCLYDGAACLVEESATLLPSARAQIVALWESVGARVVSIEPQRHDEVLAHTSHLPHVMAACIAATTDPLGEVAALIGNVFRDTTRIAASRPEVWTEICLTNRDALLAGLGDYEQWLAGFRAALEAGDAAAVEQCFAQGKAARERICGS